MHGAENDDEPQETGIEDKQCHQREMLPSGNETDKLASLLLQGARKHGMQYGTVGHAEWMVCAGVAT